MTKRSGYEITVKVFLPCDPNMRGSMALAERSLERMLEGLRDWHFIVVDTKVKYRQRADVPDDPDFREADEPATGDGAALASVGEQVAAGVNRDDAMPERLRRARHD